MQSSPPALHGVDPNPPDDEFLDDDLPELAALRALAAEAGPALQTRQLCTVDCGARRFPVLAMCLGNPDPGVPAVGFFGGVHGLERIGAAVVIAWLRSLVSRLAWDDTLHRQLESVRLVFMPLVNPGGTWRGTRANPNGVDLMRNAPVDAERALALVGGQRLGPRLPWYRGAAGAPMEAEAQALCGLVESELLGRPFSLALDCHSGFGLVDRLWFPYAHTARPFPWLAEVHALAAIFEASHPQHRYVIEPQSRQYLTHGDLWDHLVARAAPGSVFVPLTLEMGSWLWVRKNPRQLLSRHGLFNPQVAHREQRVLRRHAPWFDFLVRAAIGHARWCPTPTARAQQHERALDRWYRGQRP